MGQIPREVWDEMQRDAARMEEAKLPRADIDAYLDFRASQYGAGAGGPLDKPKADEALNVTQKMALFAGPAVGGMAGAQLSAGRNLIPALGGAGRAATQFLGEAGGIAAGDVAGRFAAGVPQDPKGTLQAAGGGAALGSLIRGTVQLGGAYGGIPEAATQAAAEPARVRIPLTRSSVPVPLPNLRRVSRAGPHSAEQVKQGISPEAALVDRASTAAGKLKATITQARAEKVAIIQQADASGVRIPVAPIQDALREHLVTDPGTLTREAMAVNARIQGVITRLDNVTAGTGGTLSPGQVDRIIRQQFRPRVYTGSGAPSHAMFAGPMASAEEAASKALTQALPGNIAAKNAEISQRLTAAEHAEKLFGDADRAGVTSRLASAFNSNNETTARALQTLKLHDPTLVDDAYDLYVRRQLGGDIRASDVGGGYEAFFGKPVRLGVRAIAPLQRLGGGYGAGAYEALSGVTQQ